MSYKEKPQIKLYKYQNSAFVLQAIIDDYAECSFENNRFQAGQFSITINYNIPNALLFERGLFVQFGNNPYNFGEIFDVFDSIGSDGKGSQIRNIIGYDIRYIFKRRIIKNLNNNDTWAMTAKGELCMRNLIQDQCGSNAEVKRRLPVINTIPSSENAIGNEYSVSESFSNLYDVLTTIATQTEIGWRINFNGETLTLEFYLGEDKHTTVRFDTDYESLNEGQFTDSSSSFVNAIFVGGKGTGSERDIYEGENAIEGNSPSGLDRFEAWDNQSEMTTEEDYAAEALSMLGQYGQTLQVSGKGLAKCPYEYGEEYEVGDVITIAFSGKSAVVQILSVTEHWVFGNYNLDFEFGKPQPDLSQQLQLLLRQIQKASSKTNSTESVKWYTIPTDSEMPSSDVTFNTIGFTGTLSQNRTFTFYLDNEKTGAKNYTIYLKNLSGNYKLILTTGKSGATNTELSGGVNTVAKILIDESGNIITEKVATTSVVESGNNLPVTSDGVAQALAGIGNQPNVSNATGTLPVANGGTGQTTQIDTNKAIVAAMTEGTSNVTDGTMFVSSYASDDGFSKQSPYTNLPYKRKFIAVWNYIKSKIQSIALTIGSTAAAVAETLYGSITVKNSNGTTTASISQAGAITGASVVVGGNVLGSNVPHFGTVYSSNTYNSGYYEIARLEGAAASGNHSISMEGTVISDKTGTIKISDFYVFIRGDNATVSTKIFNCVGRYSNADLTATYEVFDTNKFRIRLYGKITGRYHRYNTVIKYASTGDVSDRTSNRTVTFPNTYVTDVVGTSITKNVNYAGDVTGSSGSCSGNSSTADTTRGTAYCTTAGETQAKVASMRGFVLQSDVVFLITFTNANSYDGVITLNVNSTGAKNIYINNDITSSSNKTLPAGTYLCKYNGTNYYIELTYCVTTSRYAYNSDYAGVANKIRTSVSSPSDGDIWIE